MAYRETTVARGGRSRDSGRGRQDRRLRTVRNITENRIPLSEFQGAA